MSRKRNVKYDKAYRAAHLKEHREEAVKYREKYPERVKETTRKYRETHSEEIKRKREENKEKRAVYNKKYNEIHKEEQQPQRVLKREEKAAYDKLYRESKKEEIKIKRKAFYILNKDKISEKVKIKRQNDSLFREKSNKRSKEWQDAHQDDLKAYRASRVEIERDLWMFGKYGVTRDDYNNLLVKQNNVCAICESLNPGSKHGNFFIDHDHKTNVVRGLLCRFCNAGLGGFCDLSDRMRDAALYIEKNCDLKGIDDSKFSKLYVENLRREKFYDILVLKRGDFCFICNKSSNGRKFHVDHDHVTNRIRGLLCTKCNLAIGCFKDNPETIRLAALYIDNNGVKYKDVI